MLWVTVIVYPGDVVVYTDILQAPLPALHEVFLRLRNAGLKAFPSKCELRSNCRTWGTSLQERERCQTLT